MVGMNGLFKKLILTALLFLMLSQRSVFQIQVVKLGPNHISVVPTHSLQIYAWGIKWVLVIIQQCCIVGRLSSGFWFWIFIDFLLFFVSVFVYNFMRTIYIIIGLIINVIDNLVYISVSFL